MVRASEIRDEASLRAWMEGRPRKDAVAIAARAALRVAPLYWEWVAGARQHIELREQTVSRLLLIAIVGARKSTPKIRAAAAAAVREAVASRSKDVSARPEGFAILSDEYAGYTYPSGFADDSVDTAVAAVASAGTSSAVRAIASAGSAVAKADRIDRLFATASEGEYEAGLWKEIADDCYWLEKKDLLLRPLWHGSAPDWVPIARRDWRARGGAWEFWADWYEGYLTGQPLDIDLLQKVAEIEPEDWDKGDDHVNRMIARYYDDWRLTGLVERTPNAEHIAVNADTGRFYAEPISDVPPDYLADARDKMAEANAIFEGAEGGNDPYGMLKPERDIIDRALSAYRERPMMLHDACRRASRRVQGKVARGDCPEHDPLIEDYVRQLDEVAGDLLAFDPKVKEVVVARVQGAIEAASPEKRQLLVDAAEAGAAASEGVLAEELPADALVATDPAEPLESRKEATYRFTSRIARMYSLGRKGLSEVSGVTKDAVVVGGGLYALWKAIPYLLTLL